MRTQLSVVACLTCLSGPVLAQSLVIGDTLPMSGIVRPALVNMRFNEPLVTTLDHVDVQAPKPFSNAIVWTEGYIHAQAATGSANPYGKPGVPYPGFSRLNNESAVFPNADEQAKCPDGQTVFVADGLLQLVDKAIGACMKADLPADYADAGYVGGAVTSYPFSMTYGYIEVRAKLPAGAWPAIWLLPEDGSWPPEIDIVETFGIDPTTIFVSAHSKDQPWIQKTIELAFDTSKGFHYYGLWWGKETTCTYVDRVAVQCIPTPADWDKPMYLLLDTTLGSVPNANTPLPAVMQIQSVGVWNVTE